MRIRASIHPLLFAAFLCCALSIIGCAKSGGAQQAPNPPPPAGEVAPPVVAPPAAEPPANEQPAPSGDPHDDPNNPTVYADCDQSKIRCRRMAPQCPTGQVPSVSGSCFGDCVDIGKCACSTTVACPQSGQYACWYNTHCGPYVR